MFDEAVRPDGPAPNGSARSDSACLRFAPGATLSLPTDACWTLVRGDVTVYRAGRPIEVWRSPCPLDIAGSVSGERRAQFVAASHVEVVGTPRDGLSARETAALLADENARLWARIEHDARRDDDTFLPYARPVPGPWLFRKAHAITLVVQGDANKLRAGLPRGVSLLPGTSGRYLVAMTRFEDVGSTDARDASRFVYHEVTPFVPVWSAWRGPAAFIPELYPDSWMAVILGREIHGFPKRTARIGFHEQGGELLVDRRLALRVRYRERSAVPPSAALAEIAGAMCGSRPVAHYLRKGIESFLPRQLGLLAGVRLPVLVHKRIGACESAGRTLAIDDVVRVPLTLEPVTRAFSLDGLDVDLPGGTGVLHGEVLGGFYLEAGFRFGNGTVDRKRGSR